MQLISINIAKPRPLSNGRRAFTTGIFKEPTSASVAVGKLGLAGDTVANKRHHGGPDQAVYVYTEPDYGWWSAELGRTLTPGVFGDNLTIGALESASLALGDRLHIGEVTLEVTAPRVPCNTLAARMGDPTFIKRFRLAGRPGAYCRVLVPGVIATGEAVSVEPYEGDRITLGQALRDHYRRLDAAALDRYLALPLARRMRGTLEQQLARLSREAQM